MLHGILNSTHIKKIFESDYEGNFSEFFDIVSKTWVASKN